MDCLSIDFYEGDMNKNKLYSTSQPQWIVYKPQACFIDSVFLNHAIFKNVYVSWNTS